MEPLHPRDPHHIGPYRLLARLGSGADADAGTMGRVYLARSEYRGTDTDTGTGTGTGTGNPGPRPRPHTAAVKLICPALAAHPDFRARFRREVAAARLVGGAWTAPLLDADPDAEVPWLATAYIPGPSLREAVDRDFGRLPTRTVRVLAEGLSYALQDIHRAGLVHRNLKPADVLLTIDGPRLIGLATASTHHHPHARAHLHTPELPASLPFLSPEQLHGTQPVTPACDVFGLGAVLAYAATGRPPFGDAEQPGGTAALRLRISEAEPDLDDVAPALRDLVRDCLRKEPTARPMPAEVLARVAAGRAAAPDPWLPEQVVARLGQHAAALLDREEAGPDRRPAPAAPARPTPSLYIEEAEPHPQSRPGSRPGPGPNPAPDSCSVPVSPSTAFLVAVAAVVTVAAGGSVYAIMSGDERPLYAPGAPPPTPTGPARAPSSAPSAIGTPAPAALSPAYLGSWYAASDTETWQLTLSPGTVGSPVMSLTLRSADGLDCSWTAPLRSAAPDTVELGPSTVTPGTPSTCPPDGPSALRPLPDGSLVRELADTPGTPLTYHRG
ncbi:serine/threonine-protein kinase [Streptomyces sp. NPDC059443]|uniref:serine/threonine-protein kinase n=1 Tax=unclassified Streptomyces TaxID=2593676 RepID=UPI003684EEAB